MFAKRQETNSKEKINQAFQLEVFQPLKPGASTEHCCIIKGYSALFLGKVPTYESSGEGCTDYCVEKVLDRYNIDESRAHEVYLDVKNIGLLMYYVDDDGKLLQTRLFDLARISYCCGDHQVQPRIFSWVYKQETETGFQLECYAVRCSTEKKPRVIAQHLYRACEKLYFEIQAALESGKTFSEACKKTPSRNMNDIMEGIEKSTDRRESSGSFGLHIFGDNEDLVDLDFDADSVFGSPECSNLNYAVLDVNDEELTNIRYVADV